jgi:carboxypeptidase T
VYLNVVEVESALQVLTAGPNAAFTELVTLPHRTWENRVCRAVRVAADPTTTRPAVYLIGGVHAREWGSPDILVSFLERLTAAYSGGTGIDLPGYSVSAADVTRIVTGLDLVVFPQVNPDGRAYSMDPDGDEMWRKNRRPAPPGSPCPGVDVNRNYDWLWDFRRHFHPASRVSNSTDPCSEVYVGPAAFSEPETRNVAWLFDRFPETRFFVDVHSFSELVLHPWGDDDNQAVDPAMDFRNPAFDGRRGILDATGRPDAGDYRAYLDAGDGRSLGELGRRMADAVAAVHGRRYRVQQGANLYPTGGTSEDWAYARHRADPARAKVYPFVVEWGRERASIAESFHPPYAEMARIIEENVAGLLEFCLAALDRLDAERFEGLRPGRFAELVRVLFGVTSDGGGVVLGPEGRPVPIPPWDPAHGLEPAHRQLLAGLAAGELAGLVDDAGAQEALRAAGLRAAVEAAGRIDGG